MYKIKQKLNKFVILKEFLKGLKRLTKLNP